MDLEFFKRRICYPAGEPQEWQDKLAALVRPMMRKDKDVASCIAVAAQGKTGKTTFAFKMIADMFEYEAEKDQHGEACLDVLFIVPSSGMGTAEYSYQLAQYLREHIGDKYGVFYIDIENGVIYADMSRVRIWVRVSAVCLLSHDFGSIVADDANKFDPLLLWYILEYTHEHDIPSLLIGGETGRTEGTMDKRIWSMILNNPRVRTFIVGREMFRNH